MGMFIDQPVSGGGVQREALRNQVGQARKEIGNGALAAGMILTRR